MGLVTEERTGPDDANPNLSCHELVRERIRAWMAQRPQDQGDLTETTVRLAYAEWLQATFDALQQRNMTAALQAGSRALIYCVQAQAWDQLSGFASSLVNGTRDPRLLDALIPHLLTSAETAPEGEARWLCLSFLADALQHSGRPDSSLPLFARAATLARTEAETQGNNARHDRYNLSSIIGNSANAFRNIGYLDAARTRWIESTSILRNADAPAINLICAELETLRIDIRKGKVEAALPEIEMRLMQVQAWWERHRAGQKVPEAPDASFLARALLGALNIASEADFARENWESALSRLETMLGVEQTLQHPAEDIVNTRINRANVLKKISGRQDEAKAELEACLLLCQKNPAARATVFSSLASLFDKQDDITQAIAQAGRALALRNQLPDPAERVISHGNLCIYLERRRFPEDFTASGRNLLAALLYCLVIDHGQHLQITFHNYTIRFRHANANGEALAVLRIADLVADPAFAPLEQWLRQRQVSLDALQAAVDDALDKARQAALSAEHTP